MGRRAHVRLDDPLASPRARLRRAHRLFRSHDPRRSRKRPAQANSSRIGVFKRTLRTPTSITATIPNSGRANRAVSWRLADSVIDPAVLSGTSQLAERAQRVAHLAINMSLRFLAQIAYDQAKAGVLSPPAS